MSRRIEVIKKELIQQFGNLYAVQGIHDSTGKLRYHIKCPEKDCMFHGQDLKRHLSGKGHGWEVCKAKVRIFNTIVVSF